MTRIKLTCFLFSTFCLSIGTFKMRFDMNPDDFPIGIEPRRFEIRDIEAPLGSVVTRSKPSMIEGQKKGEILEKVETFTKDNLKLTWRSDQFPNVISTEVSLTAVNVEIRPPKNQKKSKNVVRK